MANSASCAAPGWAQRTGMASLTVEGMCERLAKEFDSEVVETFRTNKIDGSVFIELEESDMKELGIVALGDRKKLKKLIRTLQESQENVSTVCTKPYNG